MNAMQAIGANEVAQVDAIINGLEIVGWRDNLDKKNKYSWRGPRAVMTVFDPAMPAIDPKTGNNQKRYTTAIQHPQYAGCTQIEVETYLTAEEALQGHRRWERRLMGKKRLPDSITDIKGVSFPITKRYYRD